MSSEYTAILGNAVLGRMILGNLPDAIDESVSLDCPLGDMEAALTMEIYDMVLTLECSL